MTSTDSLGIAILPGDTVRILAYGYGIAKSDTGREVIVTGFTAAGNVKHDTDTACGRALRPGCLGVVRRDGNGNGYEGNRPRCSCGAHDHTGCFCGLTPREFYATRAAS